MTDTEKSITPLRNPQPGETNKATDLLVPTGDPTAQDFFVQLGQSGAHANSDAADLDDHAWSLASEEPELMSDIVDLSLRIEQRSKRWLQSDLPTASSPEVAPSQRPVDLSYSAVEAFRQAWTHLLRELSWQWRPLRPAMRRPADRAESMQALSSEPKLTRPMVEAESFEAMQHGALLAGELDLVGQRQPRNVEGCSSARLVMTILRPNANLAYQFRASLDPRFLEGEKPWVASVKIYNQEGSSVRGTLSPRRKTCYLTGDKFFEGLRDLKIDVSFEVADANHR